MTDKQRAERWLSAICAIPWLAIVGVYMEAGAARLVLGRWPRPMLDDPKLATAPLDLVLWALLLSLGVAVPLLIVFAVGNCRKIIGDWRYRVRIGVFAIGVLAIWTLTHYDPGRVWAWFLD
jgi:hypothetical protein